MHPLSERDRAQKDYGKVELSTYCLVVERTLSMSKKAERRERRKGRLKNQFWGDLSVAGVGLVFLVLGLVGLIGNLLEYHDYRDTEEIITVPAKVTYVEVKERKNNYGRPEMYWEAELTYSAGTQEYKGKAEYETRTEAGDTKEIEVYRSRNGKYKMPKIKSGEMLLIADVMPIISLALGALLTFAGLFLAGGVWKELRQAKE